VTTYAKRPRDFAYMALATALRPAREPGTVRTVGGP
jgi:hypothetical protein